ncbi:hypothetical protein C2E23DRAFT_84752 [Lenzites betulinus]|nr:hypothetical protein C2E23DRAFT_84752 [Lenzites betulinus]
MTPLCGLPGTRVWACPGNRRWHGRLYWSRKDLAACAYTGGVGRIMGLNRQNGMSGSRTANAQHVVATHEASWRARWRYSRFYQFPWPLCCICVKITRQGANERSTRDASMLRVEGPVDLNGIRRLLRDPTFRAPGQGAASSDLPRTPPYIIQHFLIEFPQAPPRNSYVARLAYGMSEGPQASPYRFTRVVRERGQHATRLGPLLASPPVK